MEFITRSQIGSVAELFPETCTQYVTPEDLDVRAFQPKGSEEQEGVEAPPGGAEVAGKAAPLATSMGFDPEKESDVRGSVEADVAGLGVDGAPAASMGLAPENEPSSVGTVFVDFPVAALT